MRTLLGFDTTLHFIPSLLNRRYVLLNQLVEERNVLVGDAAPYGDGMLRLK